MRRFTLDNPKWVQKETKYSDRFAIRHKETKLFYKTGNDGVPTWSLNPKQLFNSSEIKRFITTSRTIADYEILKVSLTFDTDIGNELRNKYSKKILQMV